MRDIQGKASDSLTKAAADMKKYYDRRRAPVPDYKAGDKVWLDGSNISPLDPQRSLTISVYGPFIIEHLIPPNAVRLKLPPTMHIHPVFNVVKILPFHEDALAHPIDQTRPPPAVTHTVPRYEVESLRDIKAKGRGFQYLVHWLGYPNEEDEWVNASELRQNSPDLVAEFHIKYPLSLDPWLQTKSDNCRFDQSLLH